MPLFEEWLKTPPGAQHTGYNTQRTKRDVSFVLEQIAQGEDNFDPLDFDQINNNFIKPALDWTVGNIKQPNTIKANLNRLQHYYIFLLLSMKTIKHSEFLICVKQNRIWCNSMKNLAKKNHLNKHSDIHEELITPKHIKAFMFSDYVKETKTYFLKKTRYYSQ
ncbi:unnamed protein product, partial [Owenia fusiformis]